MALDLVLSSSKTGVGCKSPEEHFSGVKFLLHSVRSAFTYVQGGCGGQAWIHGLPRVNKLNC